MVAICCFQCDPRLATYIISIISVLHFSVETFLLAKLDTEHRLVAEDDGIKFYTVYYTHIFLLVASLFLFYSAYALIRYLSIPWLLGCAFNLIIYCSLLILILMRVLSAWNSVEMEKGIFIGLNIVTLSYCMWIVIVFFLEVGKDSTSTSDNGDSGSGKRSKSVFTLYDTGNETEGDEEQNLFPSKKLGSRTNMNGNKQTKDDALPLLPGGRRSSKH